MQRLKCSILFYNFASCTNHHNDMNNFTMIITGIGVALVALYFILNKFHRNVVDVEDHHGGEDGTCCGKHTVCTHGYDNSNLYFDDEELDRFKEKPQNEYTEEDVEEFRNILYTMDSKEVATWVGCLQKRRIELPAQIKDEIFLILQ